jgi:hypothetical protein
MALAELEALIGTFPFVSKADEAVAISNILTATIRRSLRTTPLHGFSAPAAGSGKTKLVDIASVIANGREAGVIAQGADDAETEKRLVGLLLGGETVVAIDNCENPVGGDFLCQVLTQTRVQARILGASKIVELPTGALVTATGNNLTIYGDMTRRSVVCNLDPRCERPELRHFDSEPVQDAKARRGRYLVAALTVLRAYRLAPEGGRGPEPKPIGSFEEWSAWVRNALLWLGRGDPAATMEATRRQDPVLLNLSTLIEQWWHAIGPETITVKNAIAFAAGNEELRDAMLAVAGQRGEIQPLVLGKYLGKIEGRVVGGRRMVKDGMQQGSQKWKLEAIERVVAGA